MYVHYAIDLVKQKYNVGYVVEGFFTNAKETQEKRVVKEYPHETFTSVKKTRSRSN